jgi:hypothetical protein
LGRLFWFRRFDTALEWLLFCVKEFQDHAAVTDKTFKPRYPIKDDTIGGLSIKSQFNQGMRGGCCVIVVFCALPILTLCFPRRCEMDQSAQVPAHKPEASAGLVQQEIRLIACCLLHVTHLQSARLRVV